MQENISQNYQITQTLFNIRLDKLLTILNKDLSLRAAKRLCENALVYVHNKPQKPAYKINRLCEVQILKKQTSFDPNSCKLVYKNADYALIYKNNFIHTAKIEAALDSSLEENLSLYLENTNGVELLNRLDFETSGLVVLALNAKAKSAWIQAENEQQIEKKYLALVEGELKDCKLNYEFVTKNRQKTLIKVSQNNIRTTLVENIFTGYFNDLACEKYGIKRMNCANNPLISLVQATIYKGARHQIRASLAYNGNPLLFDQLYGAKNLSENESFLLHNYAINCPFFTFNLHSEEF